MGKQEIDLYRIESALYQKGCSYICGVDEAGRGPLAGPVVAAAVILPRDAVIEGINDSKKLTEKKRERLYDEIIARCVCYAIASCDNDEIDAYNILGATHIAMNKAVAALAVCPDYVLVDGNSDPKNGLPTQTVIDGDALSASIGAASILAKVYRDRLMAELDLAYPGYLLAQHKGYPTKLHYDKILEHGISPIHRMSFLKKLLTQHPHLIVNR